MKKTFLFAALAVVLVVGAYAAIQQSLARTVFHRARSAAVTVPANATPQDHANLAKNLLFGTHLPTSIGIVELQAEIKAVLTGLVFPQTGEEQMVVTLLDDTPDLSEARLYVAGQLVATATRANGTIIDKNGIGIATLTTFVLEGSVTNIELKWTTSVGRELFSAVTL
jgi:hypothetical protein